MVVLGLTVFETTLVSAASLYHVDVPLTQVADKVELCPEQIVLGLADTAVGADGVGFTVTVKFVELLLHPALLRHAT
ncbi:hypothetical protein MCERE19_01186 [Spirosomataceae bacterium]